jgi:hypothetical protein
MSLEIMLNVVSVIFWRYNNLIRIIETFSAFFGILKSRDKYIFVSTKANVTHDNLQFS